VMLTAEGLPRLWAILAGQSDDSLGAARLVVRNGTQEASAELDGPPAIEGGTITLRATFGEQDANFEWSSRDVVSDQGVVIDHEEHDFGRKQGGEWTLEAAIDLAPQES
jgi:hypothetical protein